VKLLLAIVGIALALSLAMRRRNPALFNLLTVGFAVLTIGLVIVMVTRDQLGGQNIPPGYIRMEEGLGYVLGQAIAKDFPGGGSVIVLQLPTTSSKPNPVSEARLKGLKEGFGKSKLTIAAVEPTKTRLDDFYRIYDPDGGIPARFFNEMLSTYGTSVAFVSFMGLPDMQPTDVKGTIPALYAQDHRAEELMKPWMDRNILKAVVAYRQDADGAAVPGPRASLEEAFAMRYLLHRAK
jgi:hypothetical protein